MITTKNNSSSKKFLFYFGFPFIAKLVFAAIGGTLLELPLALKDV